MTQQCQHAACTCQHEESQMVQRNGAYYCSEECAAHAAEKGACPCGHAECEGSRRSAAEAR